MKILVRATNWVGDAVMSIPAIAALRSRWPQAEIAILGRPWVVELYRGQGYADRLIAFDHAGRHRGVAGRERLAAELRRERFDVAVLLQNAFEAAWLAWRAGIAERIGYVRDARGFLLTRAIPTPRRREVPAHETYYYLELLRRVGWRERLENVERIELRVHCAEAERGEAAREDAGAGLPVVGIFGPTDPGGTQPVTPHFTLVRQPVSCSPCFLRQCPVDQRCMTRIAVDAVYSAARPWLAQSSGRSAARV